MKKIKISLDDLKNAEKLSMDQMKGIQGGACSTSSCSAGGQSGTCVTDSQGGGCLCKVATGYGTTIDCWG